MSSSDVKTALLAEVRAALQIYFDAMYECDVEILDRIFHPCSSLFTSVDGVMTLRPFVQYRTEIARRKSQIGRAHV